MPSFHPAIPLSQQVLAAALFAGAAARVRASVGADTERKRRTVVPARVRSAVGIRTVDPTPRPGHRRVLGTSR